MGGDVGLPLEHDDVGVLVGAGDLAAGGQAEDPRANDYVTHGVKITALRISAIPSRRRALGIQSLPFARLAGDRGIVRMWWMQNLPRSGADASSAGFA